MPKVTPRQTVKIAAWVLGATGPLAALTLVAWGFRWIDFGRPQLVLMVYLALLFVCVAAASVVAIAGCHLTVVRAFTAGVRVGQTMPDDHPGRPDLQVIDGEA